jgi:EAL domain-containing protein (putative c-di-GMP-specific phosphodiesterase class I)
MEAMPVSELVSTMTVREIARQAAEAIWALRQLSSDDGELTDPAEAGEVIADLERMVEHLPQVCEQLARFLVASHEDRQIAGEDVDLSVAVSAEALSTAGQAADMLAAALAEARVASAGLRPVR